MENKERDNTNNVTLDDRPGWIPPEVGDDWDPNPYAYQTEEEMMPAGYQHNRYLQILTQMLEPYLQTLGCIVMLDVFVFYRDATGRKQRTAPDMLIAHSIELTEQQLAYSYDLDIQPVPSCLVEITSDTSHHKDFYEQPLLYASWGVFEYLVLDIVDTQGLIRPQIGVYLWQLVDGHYQETTPDKDGYQVLHSIGVRLKANGRHLVAEVLETGEPLLTSAEKDGVIEATEARERQIRAESEAKIAALEAEIERLRKASEQ
jgi:hypothetical protein